MFKKLFVVWMTLVCTMAHASDATVTCGGDGSDHNGVPPVVTLNYSPGGDVGVPGLFFVGILTPDQQSGAVLSGGNWVAFQGGLLPFQGRYDSGLPGLISLQLNFPDGGLTTAAYVGYQLYAGHGAYSAQGRAMVAERRRSLNEIKPTLMAEGKWQASFDNDDQYIYALVMKDMTDGQKYVPMLSIPLVDCTLIPKGNH